MTTHAAATQHTSQAGRPRWRPQGPFAPWLLGPFARWPRAADAALAAAVFLLVVFVSAETGQGMAIRPVSEIPADAFLISAVAAGALYWRRRMPLAAWGVAMLGAAGSLAIGSWNIVGVAVIALYSVGRYVSDHRWSYLSAASTIGLAAVGDRVDGLAAADSVGGLVVIFLLWYAGRRIRFRGERAAQVERERAAEARRAVAEERTRIARELHDVVAHRVSMMTVQAGAAKMVVADDPGGARRAMEAVEHTGREALDELRHLLTVLRPVAGAGDLGPQPGLLDVPRLLDQLREAGLDVSLTTHGALPDLPTRVSLSAYRIIQEALTNVLRHAGPACRAEVRLSTDGAGVAIEVLDDGSGVAALSGSGHGIVGMRERALLLGGSLDAGQRPSGGFQVTAWLPLREEPA